MANEYEKQMEGRVLRATAADGPREGSPRVMTWEFEPADGPSEGSPRTADGPDEGSPRDA